MNRRCASRVAGQGKFIIGNFNLRLRHRPSLDLRLQLKEVRHYCRVFKFQVLLAIEVRKVNRYIHCILYTNKPRVRR
ncbi:hypothetical protein JTE90_023079 [Oedothorax gibbosus]|uniref:Uncharacterized protein n=1 Tax=Oedothorax gibbosus TaxID=931172 RepID=A0AAV6UX75_9ARAC|nr:hypothetical protein JTE90_023079 [Oedothorax gibbosus]